MLAVLALAASASLRPVAADERPPACTVAGTGDTYHKDAGDTGTAGEHAAACVPPPET